ncbi:MAG: hypothetical protein JJT95_09835 [Pararhodobacter sp.]|nr:hypothetical protein [Pararhodobacter sp.]
MALRVQSRALSGRGAAILALIHGALLQPNPRKIEAMRKWQPDRRAVGTARRCAAAFDLDFAQEIAQTVRKGLDDADCARAG